MSNITQKSNNNVASVRHQINQKMKSKPFYGTITDSDSVITDMDHFPYTRFFRGVYHSPNPIVFEREAGWRPLRNSSYKAAACHVKPQPSGLCFENACSTVYPCYAKTLHSYSDRDSLNTQSNNNCITHFQ